MTEAEWLACTQPAPMLEFLEGKVSDRKLLLFGCACCHRIWDYLTDPRSRATVERVARYADGLANDNEFIAAVEDAQELLKEIDNPGVAASLVHAATAAYYAAYTAFGVNIAWPETAPSYYPGFTQQRNTAFAAHHVACYAASAAKNGDAALHSREQIAQTQLLRDIFNPFRSVSLNSAWIVWNGSTVVKIAQATYDDRSFEHLPILADALEDAGCGNADILEHLRGPGPHYRGCWALDLILNRS
jgi:hypothetical protein